MVLKSKLTEELSDLFDLWVKNRRGVHTESHSADRYHWRTQYPKMKKMTTKTKKPLGDLKNDSQTSTWSFSCAEKHGQPLAACIFGLKRSAAVCFCHRIKTLFHSSLIAELSESYQTCPFGTSSFCPQDVRFSLFPHSSLQAKIIRNQSLTTIVSDKTIDKLIVSEPRQSGSTCQTNSLCKLHSRQCHQPSVIINQKLQYLRAKYSSRRFHSLCRAFVATSTKTASYLSNMTHTATDYPAA